jgi:hypothetical protein
VHDAPDRAETGCSLGERRDVTRRRHIHLHGVYVVAIARQRVAEALELRFVVVGDHHRAPGSDAARDRFAHPARAGYNEDISH